MTGHVNLGPWLAWGCVLGIAIYLIACIRKRVTPDLGAAILAILAGGGLVAGPHLVICCFSPHQLVHLVADEGAHVDMTKIHVTLGDLHTVDVFVGGVAVLMVSIGELASLWKKPVHD